MPNPGYVLAESRGICRNYFCTHVVSIFIANSALCKKLQSPITKLLSFYAFLWQVHIFALLNHTNKMALFGNWGK